MLTNVSKQDKEVAARKMYKVYFNLQDYEGAEKESDMEVSLEALLPELDMAIVESYSADVRSGGLGFSSTHGLMLAEGLSAPKNPYWRTQRILLKLKHLCTILIMHYVALGLKRSLYKPQRCGTMEGRNERAEGGGVTCYKDAVILTVTGTLRYTHLLPTVIGIGRGDTALSMHLM
jgi:hypothetical protein